MAAISYVFGEATEIWIANTNGQTLLKGEKLRISFSNQARADRRDH